MINKIEDVWKRIDKKGQNDCWEWRGCLTDGYGRMSINHKDYRTHRLVYQLTYGSIPNELFVLHKCNNRKCCNPNHLYTGTNKDNMDQKILDKRAPDFKGELNPNSKLTQKDVDEIRNLKSTTTLNELSKKFNVSGRQICYILSKTYWK